MKTRAVAIAALLTSALQAWADTEPAWQGCGALRVCVKVDPVDLGRREGDELVARCRLDLPRMVREAGGDGSVDLASLQVQQFDPDTGKAIPFRSFDGGRSVFDRPCRFEDDLLPEEYPDRVGAASDAPDGRPSAVARDRGARLFNREMQPRSGTLVWTHTQTGNQTSHYAIYFDVRPDPGHNGPAPSPWIGDADLYRKAEGSPIGGMSHWNVCTADFDGDGLFDLFGGVEKGQLFFFPNHGVPGKPRFTGCRILTDEKGPIDAGWYCEPSVADWDGDGLPDLLIGTMHNAIVWWKNTGTRSEPALSYQGFVQADGKRLEVPAAPVEEDKAGIFKVDYYNSPAVCDWDGDGLPDILTGGYTTGRIFFYRCTGRDARGVPILQYVGPLEADGKILDTGWSATPTAHDFDGDGKLELITGSWDFQKGHNPDRYLMYHRNEGTPEQPRLVRKPFPKRGAFPLHIVARAAVADWNDDGLLDLLVSDHSGDTSVLLNVGTRTEPLWDCDGPKVTGSWGFVGVDLSQGPEDFVILAYDYMITSMADVDGDGITELMSGDEVHSFTGPPNSPRLVRKGELKTGDSKLMNPGPGYGDEYNWNVFHDWDKDGRLDILCGTQQGNIFFHKAIGDRESALSYAPGVKLRLTSGADLQVGPPVRTNVEEVRDFTELQGARIKFNACDVDGDSVDDLVVTETFDNVWVFRNTAAGGVDTLEPGVKAFTLPSRSRVNVLDWNADGKPDLVDGNTIENPGTIHLNESTPGQVRFGEAIQPLRLPWMFYGAGFFPIDWNKDGDQDFLVQSEFYCFWVERSFVQHGYRDAQETRSVERRVQASAAPTRLKVAAACLNAQLAKPRQNLARLEEACRDAAARGVRLILFPECWLTGSLSNARHPEDRTADLAVPGEVSDQLSRIASRYDMTIVVGLVETSPGGKPFNSCAVVSPQGLLGTYHKISLPNEVEKSFFQAGSQMRAFDAMGTRFCPVICADIDHESTFATAAQLGAPIVLAAIGGSGGPEALHNAGQNRERAEFHLDLWKKYFLERARKYKLWIVAVDQFGQSGDNWYASLAIVVSPEGEIVADQIGREGLLIHELDLSGSPR